MHYMNSSWAVSDFDLFDFIGQDDPESFSGETSQNGDPYSQNNQYESSGKEQKDDLMFTEMQYNDMAFNHPTGMYGTQDMNGSSFLQDDRYQNNNGSILNSTINKLHLQQQQNQNQPSTSRLSNIVSNQQPQYSAGRMRQQISTQMGQQQPINASDLAENVLLPTSSTSPQNNGYMLPQTAIKCEPGYDIAGSEYFDSTSDAESHYSHGGTRTLQTTSSKPRKYRIKPESERLQPQYRQKRMKNNDAVRRSREKSKQAQLEKEKRLHFLESEHNEHYKQVNLLKNRIKELENELIIFRKSCNCGSQFRR